MPANTTNRRVYFFDNLRWLFVLLVVVQHAAMAHARPGWWPVSEPVKSLAADWALAFCDAATMPMLFYIAGLGCLGAWALANYLLRPRPAASAAAAGALLAGMALWVTP